MRTIELTEEEHRRLSTIIERLARGGPLYLFRGERAHLQAFKDALDKTERRGRKPNG